MVEQLLLALVLAGTSLAAAVAALLGAHVYLRHSAGRARIAAALLPEPSEDAVFLFDDETLVDASDAAQALLRTLPPAPTPWARLRGWASPRFPGFAEAMGKLAEVGRLRLVSTGAPQLVLTAEWRDGLARLAMHDPQAEGRSIAVDRLSLAAAEEELGQLRSALEHTPLPVWRETPGGEVVWANPAYLRLVCGRDAAAGVLTWPLPRLFEPAAPDATATDAPRRLELPAGASGGAQWFDCHMVIEPDGTLLLHALPADAIVRAEAALRDLVQTLSRTFAHLPVGLAVFDRQRRLQLFNPALADLTTLPPAFLTARPEFEAFFDALRSRQMIPEPKDYRAWREGLTEMERAAAEGHYQEVWSLANGQTYRVTGRPHPDGAVAFLIEDVSAKVSLTRRFRAEVETGQAVLDSLDEAMAVFSPAGVLVMSNAAYVRLWGAAPDTLVGEIGVAEALRQWKSLSHPSPHWAQLRTLIGAGGSRLPWEGAIQLRDGRHMLARLKPLTGGATLVSFRPAIGAAATVEPAMASRFASAPG